MGNVRSLSICIDDQQYLIYQDDSRIDVPLSIRSWVVAEKNGSQTSKATDITDKAEMTTLLCRALQGWRAP